MIKQEGANNSDHTCRIKLCKIIDYCLGKYNVKYFTFLFTIYRNIAV